MLDSSLIAALYSTSELLLQIKSFMLLFGMHGLGILKALDFFWLALFDTWGADQNARHFRDNIWMYCLKCKSLYVY